MFMAGTGMNGTTEPYATRSRPPSNDGSEPPPVIRIDLGLTGAQILAALGGLATIITTGLTAGWLFLPAKDSELKATQALVELVRVEQRDSRASILRLTQAVDNLSSIVAALKDAPPTVVERIVTVPDAVPAPARPARPRSNPGAVRAPQ
jgi:hypothetical protein